MTIQQISQPNMISYARLFEIGPRVQSLKFVTENIQKNLVSFADKIKRKVGQHCNIIAYPHRVFNLASWKVHISGAQSELHFLVNVSGRFALPAFDEQHWPARLNIDIADHVDAFWFIQFLGQQLSAKSLSPLSTKIGDNSVYSEANDGKQS
ncbi:hypothetical protein A6046_01035 [[Haemophilus] ducreyi]|uniref:Uncharacterized protein n=3 Tax=Haemophilus ducreyi TaxID=730 RepID=Q7VMP3_HAEDU|nr:hypothetical protein [[Haemophilus] ducreyi]AAP95813.1 hypothetical protein HD_0931 [[Haemophilus] ducreyi 35000HP]AKO30849.1 hypothetical protein RY60_03675 [[Haemophilus] ducreyi]AKO32287.1 hypothetical protein RZ57_03680 [[Haemophilus] ducreyi]AKO33741.1 hypothetical protein RZ58_03695 [[Haemophilus] ducreyi]AKO35189.1 hypothetical protein RZ59_03660 [[Haemophilus] ducreyi]